MGVVHTVMYRNCYHTAHPYLLGVWQPNSFATTIITPNLSHPLEYIIPVLRMAKSQINHPLYHQGALYITAPECEHRVISVLERAKCYHRGCGIHCHIQHSALGRRHSMVKGAPDVTQGPIMRNSVHTPDPKWTLKKIIRTARRVVSIC